MKVKNHPLVRDKKKAVWLHTGSGLPAKWKTPEIFKGWKEVRLDLDERVKPDVVASITSMPNVKSGTFDGVYSCHCLEHIYCYEVPLALKEFRRVLKKDGFVVIQVPDLQSVGAALSEGKLYETLYTVPGVDPIAPIDMLYGYRKSLASGNHFMAHKTGFTESVLSTALRMCGFGAVGTFRKNFNLYAIAFVKAQKGSVINILKDVRIF